MKVFISYAKPDVATAEAIAIRLRQDRQTVFFDRSDIATSSAFDTIIRQQIARTDFLIFLASPDSLAPGAYALTELGWFKDRFQIPDGRLLTVLLRNQQLRDLPPYLRSVSIPSVEGDLLAEVTGRTLKCLHSIRQRYFRRWLIALVLALVTAGVCWTVFPKRHVQFEIIDSETGERVRRPLTLIVRDVKSGEDVTVDYEPLKETLVRGRSDDFVVQDVKGASGYQFRPGAEETKDGRRRVNLVRDDSSPDRAFRKMITPQSFVPSIKRADYEKRVIPAESTAVNVEFVCDNQTRFVVDVLFYRYYSQWDTNPLDIARDPWYGPKVCSPGISTIWSKGSFGEKTNGYFYIFGSVGGAEAELLADGYLFYSLRPTLVITPSKNTSDPSRLLDGKLVHPMHKS